LKFHLSQFSRIAIIVGLSLSLAHSASADQQPGQDILNNTAWQLVSIEAPEISSAAGTIKATLGFNKVPKNQTQKNSKLMFVVGNSNCGAYLGSAQEAGESLSINNLSADPVKCSDQDAHAEMIFLQMLGQTTHFFIDDQGNLNLEVGANSILKFAPID